jgi:arginase family enzyme
VPLTKIGAKRLASYHELHRETKDFLRNNDEHVHAFLERSFSEGFELDQFNYRRFPGFFGAPSTRDLTDVDVACVSIPMENSIPNVPGTRWGPKAVRKWSHFAAGPVHHITIVIPFELCNIIDYGDIDFSGFDLRPRLDDIFEVFLEFQRRGINTLTVGGEHTMTYPILKALGKDEPLAMIHIDAHADTGGEWGATSVTDASVMRHAVLDGEVSANIGANLCFEMLCLLAEVRVAHGGKTRKTYWKTAS